MGRLLHVRLSGRNRSDCLGGRWALAPHDGGAVPRRQDAAALRTCCSRVGERCRARGRCAECSLQQGAQGAGVDAARPQYGKQARQGPGAEPGGAWKGGGRSRRGRVESRIVWPGESHLVSAVEAALFQVDSLVQKGEGGAWEVRVGRVNRGRRFSSSRERRGVRAGRRGCGEVEGGWARRLAWRGTAQQVVPVLGAGGPEAAAVRGVAS